MDDRLPTMRDVARRAGVSLTTVSRVVNGQAVVRQETVARVRDAIGALQYQRNDIARSLRPGQRSATIGLVVPNLVQPHHSAIGSAVDQVAHAHGHMLLLGTSDDDPARERDLVRTLLGRRVDGLLVVTCDADHRHLLVDGRVPIPTVFVDRPPCGVEVDHVVFDNRSGARMAVEHLHALGHRRIAYVGRGDDGAIYPSMERMRGYRESLSAAGLEVDPDLVRPGCRSVDDARRAVVELLSLPRPPTAILAANRVLAIGAVLALHAKPTQTALVSFGEFELAEVLGATVVAHDPTALGRRAAEMLFARLQGDEGPPRRVVMPFRLLPRGSGEVPPPD